jgi:hypothetical protein
MKPTNKLRYVTRTVYAPFNSNNGYYYGGTMSYNTPFTITVLQQWWEYEEGELDKYSTIIGIWIDVPTEIVG